MFVLRKYGGEYEDAWTYNMAVSKDRSALEVLSKKDEEKYTRRERVRIALETLYAQFLLENPKPEILANYKEIVKWQSGIHMRDITPQMREERDATIKFNDDLSSLNIEIQETWRQNFWIPSLQKFLESNEDAFEIGLTGEDSYGLTHGYLNFIETPKYSIEEIDVI